MFPPGQSAVYYGRTRLLGVGHVRGVLCSAVSMLALVDAAVSADPTIVKPELRQRLRTALAGIESDDLAGRSLRAAHHVFELPEYIRAESVMVFLSLPHEVDTTPIVLRCWQDGKRVLAPKVSWNQRRMLPVEIRSLTDDLAASNKIGRAHV